MTVVWFLLGALVYLVLGTLTYGVVMRLEGCDWNDDDFFASLLAMCAGIGWPIAWASGLVYLCAGVVALSVIGLGSLLRLDKLLRYVVALGNGQLRKGAKS